MRQSSSDVATLKKGDCSDCIILDVIKLIKLLELECGLLALFEVTLTEGVGGRLVSAQEHEQAEQSNNDWWITCITLSAL